MILVTGGTGLVGAHLLYQLSLKNDIIKAIHRTSSNLAAVKKVFSYFSEDYEFLFKKIEWIEADINDIFALEFAFENITEVYHAAALVSFNEADSKKMRKINIEGTTNVVNFCIDKQVKKLCFVSSIATISKSVNHKILDETNDWDIEKSNYSYAITKYGAEMEVWRASQEGVNVVIVNPGVILGAGFWNGGSGLIFANIYKGFKFYSEGVTGFVSVYDVVKVMMQLMESTVKNERFVLVAENKSYKDLFCEIAKNFGKKPPTIKVTKIMSAVGWRFEKIKSLLTRKPPLITKQSASSVHSKRYYSSTKIKETLNFEFQPISKTVKEICTLFKI